MNRGKTFTATLTAEIRHRTGPAVDDEAHVLRWIVGDVPSFEGGFCSFRFDVCTAHGNPEDCDYDCTGQVAGYEAVIMDATPEEAEERTTDRLVWESAGTDEPGDQRADSRLTDPALGVTTMHWSLGPDGDGWSVELIGRNADGEENSAAGVHLGPLPTERVAKLAAQQYETANT